MKLPEPLWISLSEAAERVMDHVGLDGGPGGDSPEWKTVEDRLRNAFYEGEMKTRGLITAPEGYPGPWGCIDISTRFWSHGAIEWSENRMVNPTLGDEPYIHSKIEVHRQDLVQWLNSGTPDRSPEGASDQASAQAKNPGRPRKYDWEEFYIEMAILVHLDGLPETQAALESRMAGWCEENWQSVPTVSMLRNKISPFYNRLRKLLGQ